MKQCEVCKDKESRYKCPKCRTPYCSVACFKQHKDSPSCVAEASKLQQAQEADKLLKDKTAALYEEDKDNIDEGYRIQPDQLDRMLESEILQERLRDPRIREIVQLIDSAEDREKALDGAVENNKDFALFVEQLANVINPEGAPL